MKQSAVEMVLGRKGMWNQRVRGMGGWWSGGDGGGSEAGGLAASHSYSMGWWILQQVAEVIDPAGH